MDSAAYHFITHWRVLDTVKELQRGIGKVIDLHTKGWLPYAPRWQFRVTESNYPLLSMLGLDLYGWRVAARHVSTGDAEASPATAANAVGRDLLDERQRGSS